MWKILGLVAELFEKLSLKLYDLSERLCWVRCVRCGKKETKNIMNTEHGFVCEMCMTEDEWNIFNACNNR